MTDTLPSFDELVGMFAGAMESERHSAWHAGDIVNRALAEVARGMGDDETKAGRRAIRRAQRKLLGAMAEAAHCTTARVKQLGEVAATFGTEQRYQDVSWSFFRAVRNAAMRNQLDPRALLDDAIAKAMTVSDLNALGKEVPIELAASGDCAVCGSQVRVKIQGTPAARAEVHQLTIPCPACVALAWLKGTDGREANHVGALQ